MPLVLPNNYGQATLTWHYTPLARDMSVTFGFQDVPATGNANAAATAFRAPLVVVGAPSEPAAMANTWQQTGVKTLLRNNAGVLVAGADNTVTAGTAAPPANAQPVYLPYVVSKLTAFAGRHYRGRIYPPFLTTDETSIDAGGGLAPALQTAFTLRWTQWLVAVNASSYPAVLLHSNAGVVPFPTPIISLMCRPVAGVQRRRRNRGA